ncbi:MAG: D-alanine--D-alanine ligase [Deltaproteobacteria bacterium]|nr:D-alanine--D-alanine ligase [Deltaproteobacteria bacterium]
MRRKKIALLAGGWSVEREVSLKSGRAVYSALDKGKYEVTMYDPRDDLQALMEAKEEIDLAVILLHGRFGEDGRIQGLLDILKIPFLGSGVLSSAMAMNKNVAKEIYRGAGLRVAKDVILKPDDDLSVEGISAILGPYTFVKPVAEGSSLGAYLCRGNEELDFGIKQAFKYDREVMVEEYIEGREVTGCVLGNMALETLPLIEIVPKAGYRFFDYKAKYTSGATEEICPARLSRDLAEGVEACAKKAHLALRCSVWSRSDMIIRDEDIYLLETNTIPGMTENSLFPLAAKAAGLSLSALSDKMINLSLTDSR